MAASPAMSRWSPRPQTYIDDDFIRLTKDGRIEADVALDGADKAGQAVEVTRTGAETRPEGHHRRRWPRQPLAPRRPPGLKRWSPDTPTLYDVTVKRRRRCPDRPDRLPHHRGEGHADPAQRQADLPARHLPARRGVRPQSVTPHHAGSLARPAERDQDGLHGNYVRLAHYPHNEITTRMADEMGLLVWSEIPVYWSVNFSRPETLQAAQKMMAENILRDRNRASIVIWSVGNETPVSDARNHFLGTLAQEARDLDGTRLVTAALQYRHASTARPTSRSRTRWAPISMSSASTPIMAGTATTRWKMCARRSGIRITTSR